MIDLRKIIGFEWDEGNFDKNYKKHGITTKEAEEVFLDEKQLVLEDDRHSQKEERFTMIARSTNNKVLFIVFTMRGNSIRIISARKANKKEVRLYEEI